MEIPPEAAEQLGYYVYLYIDPRTGRPFYIGKGTGARALSHLTETGESEKNEIIQQIRAQGLEPQIEILRYGLTENEALLLEAALIDFAGVDHLANRVRGEHSRTFGRVSLTDLITEFSAQPVENQP